MLLGLAAAAAVGLAVYIGITLLSHLLELGVASLVFGEKWTTPPILQIVLLYLILGLPLSFALSVAIGLPIWRRAESRTLRSGRHAAKLGAMAGAIIGLLVVAFGFLMGLLTYLDANASFSKWIWGYQVREDGLPTLVGWAFEIVNVACFTLAGSAGGLAARWAVLPRART